MKMRRILSLDGGGIRGLVTCRWLQGVEAALAKGGKPGLLRSFDLLAGSSTGYNHLRWRIGFTEFPSLR